MIQRRKEEVQSVQEAEPNLQGRSEGEEETQKRSKKENRDEHSGTEDLKHRLHEEAKAVYGTGEDLVRQGKQKLAKEVEL
ncbi:hypothetical protein KP509_32G049100 [Ceratopteris richardii]|nr:hypothetical protein KP509_32G049100 [Ceratopteris richardii]